MNFRKGIERKVHLIGAGVMGTGLAHNFAENDFEVVLIDKSKDVIDGFEVALSKSYKTQCLLSSPKASFEEIWDRISITSDIRVINEAEYIIESTTENIKNKTELLRDLSRLIHDAAIIAINTSCISIRNLSQFIANPSRVLGIHFMNPVPIKHTVEVIKTKFTSQKTLDVSFSLLSLIGKNGIIVNDSPGFVINRVFMVTINEAIKTYEEKLCSSAKEIDDLFTKCLGHKMGPLMTADLIGLDTVLLSLEVLYDEYGKEMYKPSTLLVQLVDAGKIGKKVGLGFYEYI